MWLDTVRVVRDTGNIQAIFPEQVTALSDLPWTIFNAVTLGLTFLNMLENTVSEELPPRRIWLDAKKMETHWNNVQKSREAKAKGESKDIEDPVDNSAAKSLLVGD